MSEKEQKKYIELDKSRYTQRSIRDRIEALFLANLGKVITRQQIIEVAKDPFTGKEPENWHQRLSELRTDAGYTILSHRDRSDLSLQEYVMPTAAKRATAGKRVLPTKETWLRVLSRASRACEWREGGHICGMKDGDIDSIGGGTVRLTPDHKAPHSVSPVTDVHDANAWQALCGRHQVVKKNYWDNSTGKLNYHALIQAAGRDDKRVVFHFLLDHYGYYEVDDETLKRKK